MFSASVESFLAKKKLCTKLKSKIENNILRPAGSTSRISFFTLFTRFCDINEFVKSILKSYMQFPHERNWLFIALIFAREIWENFFIVCVFFWRHEANEFLALTVKQDRIINCIISQNIIVLLDR